MNWIRGESLGSGSYSSVNLVIPTEPSTKFPSPTAVKSSEVQTSDLLKNEKHVLHNLGFSPYIINCFGHDHTFEDGEDYYNLFLEYAAGGSLADQLKRHGGRLPEPYVRRCTRSIVEGLKHVHAKGFVHCDVKLENILVFDNGDVKIADFGLAKEKGQKQARWECRGTPLFMSPESVNENEYESPTDIWALGCAVVEMVTGKPALNVGSNSNIWSLLIRIGEGEESPEIPEELSEEGKDFLRQCFVRDSKKRGSAEMLLNHPFINSHICTSYQLPTPSLSPSPSPRTHFDFPLCPSTAPSPSISPRTHLDFPLCPSTVTVPSSPCSPDSNEGHKWEPEQSAADRVRRLVTEPVPLEWSDWDGWQSVR